MKPPSGRAQSTDLVDVGYGLILGVALNRDPPPPSILATIVRRLVSLRSKGRRSLAYVKWAPERAFVNGATLVNVNCSLGRRTRSC